MIRTNTIFYHSQNAEKRESALNKTYTNKIRKKNIESAAAMGATISKSFLFIFVN